MSDERVAEPGERIRDTARAGRRSKGIAGSDAVQYEAAQEHEAQRHAGPEPSDRMTNKTRRECCRKRCEAKHAERDRERVAPMDSREQTGRSGNERCQIKEMKVQTQGPHSRRQRVAREPTDKQGCKGCPEGPGKLAPQPSDRIVPPFEADHQVLLHDLVALSALPRISRHQL